MYFHSHHCRWKPWGREPLVHSFVSGPEFLATHQAFQSPLPVCITLSSPESHWVEKLITISAFLWNQLVLNILNTHTVHKPLQGFMATEKMLSLCSRNLQSQEEIEEDAYQVTQDIKCFTKYQYMKSKYRCAMSQPRETHQGLVILLCLKPITGTSIFTLLTVISKSKHTCIDSEACFNFTSLACSTTTTTNIL